MTFTQVLTILRGYMANIEAPDGSSLLDAVVARDSRFAGALETGRSYFQTWKDHSRDPSSPSLSIWPFLMALQNKVGMELKVDINQHRLKEEWQVSGGNLARLEEVLTGDGPHVVIMRHGTQFSDKPDKIEMMRFPANMKEPLTGISMAQATATGVALAVIARKLGKQIEVISSENERALQTAAIIAGIAEAGLTIDRGLNCVNYPPEKEVSNEKLLDLLGRENNGALLWREDIVDRVCGPGTFQRISRDMSRLLTRLLLRDNNVITVVVTHTQQTQAADVFAGNRPSRLRELGMRLFTPQESTLLPNGIFAK